MSRGRTGSAWGPKEADGESRRPAQQRLGLAQVGGQGLPLCCTGYEGPESSRGKWLDWMALNHTGMGVTQGLGLGHAHAEVSEGLKETSPDKGGCPLAAGQSLGTSLSTCP